MVRVTKHRLVCIIFLISIYNLGCRSKPTAPEQTPLSLKITADSFVIFSGGKLQLQALATLQDGSNKDVTTEAIWSSQPGKAGQVNEKGEFLATIGQTGIETVRAEFRGQIANAKIEVTKRAETFSIIPVRTTLVSGASIQFKAIAYYEDGTKEFVMEKTDWSLKPGIAGEIDSSGVFRASEGLNGMETVFAKFQMTSDSAKVTIGDDLQSQFEMVEIPGGTFLMGDNNGLADQKPAHPVFVDPFLISKHEVTNAQYVIFLNLALANNTIFFESNFVIGKGGRFAGLIYLLLQGSPQFPDEFIQYDQQGSLFFVKPGFDDFPVVRLTWYGAAAFCDFYGLRLPTEAEWEKACRGGQQLEYGTADGTISHELANYLGTGGRDIYEGLSPVGSFPANPFGLYDLCGNAAEYVFDVYDPNYYENSPSQNPIGPGPMTPLGRIVGALVCDGGGSLMIMRGGSWLNQPDFCKSAFRGVSCDLPDLSGTPPMTGFRVARSVH